MKLARPYASNWISAKITSELRPANEETLNADIPDLDVGKAIETAQDRENWKKIRSSKRCQPLFGDIAEEQFDTLIC